MLVGNLQLLYHQCEPQLIGTPRAGRNVHFFCDDFNFSHSSTGSYLLRSFNALRSPTYSFYWHLIGGRLITLQLQRFSLFIAIEIYTLHLQLKPPNFQIFSITLPLVFSCVSQIFTAHNPFFEDWTYNSSSINYIFLFVSWTPTVQFFACCIFLIIIALTSTWICDVIWRKQLFKENKGVGRSSWLSSSRVRSQP